MSRHRVAAATGMEMDSSAAAAASIRTPNASPAIAANSDDARRSFDEWMKIAADNNISPANTWNLALIDYFHDMSVLRDGSSINFQKASCTLDGCVKIYTSRIDSVDSETKRLLDSLADKGPSGESGVEGSSALSKHRPKHSKSSTKTLQENIAELNWKHLESEFSVDPLFKKTAAEFDEGGAQGLLLNHLMISSSGMVLFDASDVMMDGLQNPEGFDGVENELCISAAHSQQLFSKLGCHLAELNGFDICPSFSAFRFDGSADFSYDTPMNLGGMNQQQEDPDDDVEYDHYNPYDQGPMMDDDGPDASMDDNVSSGFQASQSIHPLDFSDRGDLYATGNDMVSNDDSRTANNLFSYFDVNTTRNWAGPEFWRSRSLRVSKKPEVVLDSLQKDTQKKSSQRVSSLNFLSDVPVDRDALFAPSLKANLLPKHSTKLQSSTLLPPDMHVSSANFLRYFLKPHLQIFTGARHDVRGQDRNGHDLSSKFDGLKESRLANDTEYNGNVDYAGDDGDDGDDGYYDYDQGYGDVDEGPSHGFGDTLPLGQTSSYDPSGTKMEDYKDYPMSLLPSGHQSGAAPPQLTFSKTAKRVDVKRLKENLWRTMDSRHAEHGFLGEEATTTSSSNAALSLNETPQKFSSVVSRLADAYPQQAFKDISVAFCFICVLHLANEQHLDIRDSPGLEDLSIVFPSA
ncbi:hypothetical protein BASA62_001540 [Batrachochytrium salamandrivorans]|nr:hypothetical protein BASA62_001540 [Batrachochytrium salamandrivorans]